MKMRRNPFLIILVCAIFLLIPSLVAGACPKDDTYINSSTVLSGGFCKIEDKNEDGVLIIISSNIVLDCNNTLFDGGVSKAGYTVTVPCDMGIRNITIKNCRAVNYFRGANICGLKESSIYGNIFTNMSLSGIGMPYGCSNNKITKNILEYNANEGISFYGSEYNTISENVIKYNGNGIVIKDGNGWGCHHNIIKENEIENNRNNGILYDSCKHGIISGNIIKNNSGYGILFVGDAEADDTTGNEFSSNEKGDTGFGKTIETASGGGISGFFIWSQGIPAAIFIIVLILAFVIIKIILPKYRIQSKR